MKIILTGAAGFIGSCFLWKLNSMGIDDIIVVDTVQDGHKPANLKNKKFKDYLSREDLLKSLEKGQLKEYDAIVHLGACSDTTERDQAFLTRNNLEYTKTLAKWALQNERIFHYASSAAVYGNGSLGYSDKTANFEKLQPLNLYGQSKLGFDRWVVKENLVGRFVGYRFFNVFGPNEYHKGDMRSMACKAYEQIKKEGHAVLFATSRIGFEDGSEERDFVYVKDINAVMAFFLENPEKGGIFNVGTGLTRSFKELATAVFSALGTAPKIKYGPMPEKLKGQYQYSTQADISSLREAGYALPFQSLENSISDYIKNHLNQPDPYL